MLGTWDQPVVRAQCQVECGAEATHFLLTGELVFLDTIGEEMPKTIKGMEGKVKGSVEFSWPHLNFWANETGGNWKQQILAFFAGAGVLAFFFLFLNCTTFGATFFNLLYARGMTPALPNAYDMQRTGRLATSTM